MKLITIWLNCTDEDLEENIRRIEEKLKPVGLWLKVVCVDELTGSLGNEFKLEK